jgi:Methane oxygenase PmoA
MDRRILNMALWAVIAGAGIGASTRPLAGSDKGVQVTVKEAERRVDVTVDGRPFTAYVWPTSLKKPVLYPIRTAKGTLVTRGFPLDPRPGERVDHPHHVGLWFNYGDVNGIDFWNNSDAIPEQQRPKMGTVVHKAIAVARGGPGEGILEVDAAWVMPDGSTILNERTKYVFSGTATTRTIDRITTLTAGATRVDLKDNKEGVLGLRVTRALEEPSTKPEVFTDAAGRPTTVASLDNTGVNGVYLTSEGKKGAAAWGTRGKWTTLSGKVGDEPVSIAIFDAPGNPGYPTYWHARGYGLFAANPLGQKELSGGKDVLNFAIEPNKSATFKHRIHIVTGGLTGQEAEAEWTKWTGGKGTN